jgi:hypothetical protein
VDEVQDFVVVADVAPGPVLRPDQVPVDRHVEDAAVAGDEPGLDLEFLLDRGRQTGGDGIVVSDAAVLDGDLHDPLPPSGERVEGAARPAGPRSPSRQSTRGTAADKGRGER